MADKFNISITNKLNSNPALSLVPNLRPKQIKNIEEWTSAFIVFVAIYSSHHPLEAPRLMKYMETVRDLSKRGGWAFKNYDENFRMMKQNDPSWPWDVMHSEYWMRATLTTGQNVNNSNNQSFREPQTRQPNSENLCFRFQRRGFCPFKQNCKFAHRCSLCGDTRHHHTACRKQSHMPGTASRGGAYQFGSRGHGGEVTHSVEEVLPTPTKISKLKLILQGYDVEKLNFFISGFRHGFYLGYQGPRESCFVKNSDSTKDNWEVVNTKLKKEMKMGGIAGPFNMPPFEKFSVSPLAVIPKSTPGEYRLIHNLSAPGQFC